MAVPLLYWLGVSTGNRYLLPVLLAVPAWLVMCRSLIRRGRLAALANTFLWTVALGLSASFLPTGLGPRAAAAVLNGVPYRDEMMVWVHTGIGAEGDIGQFLPQHGLHLAGFVLLARLSGGLLGLLLGTVLMNYMGFYVSTVIATSGQPALALLCGWHPWAVLRVTAFVILGVLMSEPLVLHRESRPAAWGLLGFSVTLLVADVVLKWTLAEAWRKLLLGLLSV